MTTKLLPTLVSLTLLACGGPLVADAEGSAGSDLAELKATRVRRPPAAVWAVQVSDSSIAPVFKTSFPIVTTYDVYAAFDIPVALDGQHVAAFEFVAPGGTIYQRNQVPFSSGTATSYRVWSSIPVAGTWIQQFSMTGGWMVQVFLDAEAAPRASRAFSFQ